MPRSLRPLIKNGIYHVMNRGICRKSIQFTTSHQSIFFEALRLSIEKHNTQALAYCIMKNHYHLLIKTPEANLDKFMQYFGAYLSKNINKALGGDGALFKSRYKAFLIENDTYLLQVLRYIHQNPVEAGICTSPENYPLSSMPHYIYQNGKPKWLNTTLLETYFTDLTEFNSYHEGHTNKRLKKFYKQKRHPNKLNEKTIDGNF